jgi:hypothetical protein
MKILSQIASVFVLIVAFSHLANAQNTFLPSGPAGVNTLNPAGHFQVKGDSWFDASTLFALTNNATDFGRTTFMLTGRFQQNNDAWTFGSGARNAIVFAQNEVGSGIDVGALGDEKFSLQLEGNSRSLGFLSKQMGNTPNMVMSQNGYIGIGGVSPREKLDIWGGRFSITGDDHNGTALITTHNGLALYSNNQFSNGLSISPDGNIGIGTGTVYAGAKLHVHGGAMVLGSNSIIHNTDGYLSLGNVLANSSPTLSDWASKTTMLLNGQDYSTIGFHDSGSRVDFIRVGNGTIELGYDGGFGAPNIKFPGGIWSSAGNVGIGVSSPTEKLSVNGTVKAREIRVDGQGAPDYVFEETYHKLSLAEVEKYVRLNKHLPEVPSAKELERDGMAVGEMNKLLLKKIEELTLHLIEHERKMNEQAEVLARQQKEILELKGKIK